MAIIQREDTLAIEILDDGTIRIATDQISPANHINADQFLIFLAQLAGGTVTKTKNRRGHTHIRPHNHVHHESL